MKQNKPTKSYVIIEEPIKQDWKFGISITDNETKVSDGNWNIYLPSNEKQRRGFESFCCTNFSSTNCIEILFTRKIRLKLISVNNLKWLHDNGYIDKSGNINFSDRFNALLSGTDPEWGNSLKAPAESARKDGMIPEKMLSWVENKNEYFDKAKITQKMRDLGQEFLKRFKINYEMVDEKDYQMALRISPLAIAVYAWDGTINGVFKRVENSINHAIAIIKPPDIWNIYDSYDPFIKRLANNYFFLSYALRYIVQENIQETMSNVIIDKNLRDRLYDLLFHRKADPGADSHIGKDLLRALDDWEKSREWKLLHAVIVIFRVIIKPFTIFGKKKK